MLNETLLRIGVTALLCVTICQNAAPLPQAQVLGGGKVYKTPEEIRVQYPKAKWLESKHGETSFLFCANDLPAYGNSRIEIQGWVFRTYSKMWESVLTVQLSGVVEVKLSIDPKTGLFLAKGNAENKFKDVSVCTFNLRAGE
jgi:hypothetical protein